jgi:hypothetical protein
MNEETAKVIIRQLPAVSDRVRRSLATTKASGAAWVMVASAVVSAYMTTVVGNEFARTVFSTLVPLMLVAAGVMSSKRYRSKARRGSALADAIALLSMSYAGSKLHEHIVRDAEIKRELSIVLFESDMVMRVLQSEDRSLYSQALEDVRRSEPFFR